MAQGVSLGFHFWWAYSTWFPWSSCLQQPLGYMQTGTNSKQLPKAPSCPSFVYSLRMLCLHYTLDPDHIGPTSPLPGAPCGPPIPKFGNTSQLKMGMHSSQIQWMMMKLLLVICLPLVCLVATKKVVKKSRGYHKEAYHNFGVLI